MIFVAVVALLIIIGASFFTYKHFVSSEYVAKEFTEALVSEDVDQMMKYMSSTTSLEINEENVRYLNKYYHEHQDERDILVNQLLTQAQNGTTGDQIISIQEENNFLGINTAKIHVTPVYLTIKNLDKESQKTLKLDGQKISKTTDIGPLMPGTHKLEGQTETGFGEKILIDRQLELMPASISENKMVVNMDFNDQLADNKEMQENWMRTVTDFNEGGLKYFITGDVQGLDVLTSNAVSEADQVMIGEQYEDFPEGYSIIAKNKEILFDQTSFAYEEKEVPTVSFRENLYFEEAVWETDSSEQTVALDLTYTLIYDESQKRWRIDDIQKESQAQTISELDNPIKRANQMDKTPQKPVEQKINTTEILEQTDVENLAEGFANSLAVDVSYGTFTERNYLAPGSSAYTQQEAYIESLQDTEIYLEVESVEVSDYEQVGDTLTYTTQEKFIQEKSDSKKVLDQSYHYTAKLITDSSSGSTSWMIVEISK
ncbi:TcaA NTF2-like domain-containing protein [Listeria costaricensis]|uniref:TcaA NTF2-like domain-containing protein n=1 Tax=Listeria costaricensis TaxID=2026604 RepID=UPI000C073FF1|nr:hypothetical protein [Listeria costaricensis]